MTDTIEIAAGERDVVRVFAIDLPRDRIEAFATRDADDRWPLREALHAEALDPERVEVIAVSDLADLGLAGYLSEGMGIPAAQLDPQRERLDAARGHVAVIGSAAFQGAAQTLRPEPPLRLVATFREPAPEPAGPPLRSEAAEAAALPPSGAAGPDEPRRRLPGTTVSALVLAALAAAALLFLVLSGGRP